MLPDKVHILLADDDEDDRQLFNEALIKTGKNFFLSVVEDGSKLMLKLKNEAEILPDIIFLDLNMPFKNGFQCLTEIKSEERLREIPVVIYSTSRQQPMIISTYLAGANLYVPKPTSFKEIVDVLNNIYSINWADYFPKPALDKFVFTI